jgi:hypothetical protein
MAYPKRIGTTYRDQFARPEDSIREAQEANRKADLAEVETLEPEEMPTAIYNAAFDAEVAKYAAEDATKNGEQVVNDAVGQALQAAEKRVTEANLTPERRMAKAIAAELRGQVLETGGTDVYVPTEDDVDHDAELAAFLNAPDEDQVVGTDIDGRTIFQDSAGEQYVLTDDAA